MKTNHYAQMEQAPGLLETMTIEEVREFRPEVLVIPIASTEPHGPHLPYGTDTIIGGGVSAAAVVRAIQEGGKILRLPPLPVGNNVNFKEFPFACRIRVETLMAVLMDLVTYATEEGVRKIVLFNSHGGNDSTFKAALRQLYDRFQQEAFICTCGPGTFAGPAYGKLFKDGSPHAGDYETSMVQHLAPALVREDLRRPASVNAPVLPSLRQSAPEWIRPWHLLMPESYAGHPDEASAEKGEEFFEACVAGLSAFFVELSQAPWQPNFPFPENLDTDSSAGR